jgi:hypothetical protein
MADWFELMGDFRDALAHRISLYIAPYAITTSNKGAFEQLQAQIEAAANRKDPAEYLRLSEEQQKLGLFLPWIQHSFTEGSAQIYFHGQIIADFRTVEDIAVHLLAELKK